MAEAERLPHVLLDKQHSDPAPGDLADRPGDLGDHPRREAEERLVDHQATGERHQAAGDAELLLLTTGERPSELATARFQDREQLETARVGLAEHLPSARQVSPEEEI